MHETVLDVDWELFNSTAPSTPSFIHFSELTTTSVNMSWGEPKQPNGIVEGYRVVYEPCTPVDGEKLHHTKSFWLSKL